VTYRDPSHRAVTPQDRGRFPGYDVLDEVENWDAVTAGVVLGRLALPDEIAFFTPEEVGIASVLLDLLLAQDDDPRLPVLALIDHRLAIGETDGWHYDDLPEDGQAWRDTLHLLDEDARDRFGRGFGALQRDEAAGIVSDVQELSEDGKPWHELPAKHVWSLWTRYATTAYYSHPWAWNEIGFPGPAYPRGYLALGGREHWETPDTVDVDPIPFSQRVERAHRQHDTMLGQQRPVPGPQQTLLG
jgi:hypothetical protein